MTGVVVKTTEVDISESTIQLTEIQAEYIETGIARGLQDVEARRYSSDPDEIEKDILRRLEKMEQKIK
jgi:hypothetical protein